MKGIKNYFLVVSFLVGALALPLRAHAADEYAIDKAHSALGFSVTHLMVSKVPGQFNEYDGKVIFDANDLAASKIDVTIQTASIDTNVEKRDGHLKTADFFDAAQFATITFISKSIAKEGDQYKITGDLTLKGVTKEISFSATIAGPVKTPSGDMAIGVEASFKLNRQDYGITWNKTLDNGGFMVSDEVNVNISVEAHKK